MAAQKRGTIYLENSIISEPESNYFNCHVDWEIVGTTADGGSYVINYLVTVNAISAFSIPFRFHTTLHQVSAYIGDTVIDTYHSGSAAYLQPGQTSISFGSTLYTPVRSTESYISGYTDNIRFSFYVDGESEAARPLHSFGFSDIHVRNNKYEIPPMLSTVSAPINYVGFTNNISIAKYTNSTNDSRCTSTITYSFAGLSETIVSNYVGTTCAWTIPDSFAEYLGDSISKSATLTCATYYDGVLIGTTSKTVTIAIPASTVTVASTQIGQNPTLAISKKSEDCASTLSYTFGDLTGIIVENFSGSSYSGWTIPDSFYYEMTTTKTKPCTITCETYRNSEQIGVTETTFMVSVNETVCAPRMNPTVEDANFATTELTGDSNILIKYNSRARCDANVNTYYGATVVSCYVTCGGSSISSTSGDIESPISGTFVFTVTDSRGFVITQTVSKPLIEYFKPTCYLEAHATVDGTVELSITGRVFNGSFGANDNDIKVQYHYKSSVDTSYSEWFTASHTYDGDTYNCNTTVSGLEYRNAYIVEARVVDSINIYTSSTVRTKATPIFDWSNSDFNFNVPVNINGALESDSLKVDGDAVVDNIQIKGDMEFTGDLEVDNLTINNDVSVGGALTSDSLTVDGDINCKTNLTVTNNITGSDLNITSNATFDGNVTVNGTLTVANQAGEVDYVVEQGTTTTSGNANWSWKYRRWNSGFCEAWGETSSVSVTQNGTGSVYCQFPFNLNYDYHLQITTNREYHAGNPGPVYGSYILKNSNSTTILLSYVGNDSVYSSQTVTVQVYLMGQLG